MAIIELAPEDGEDFQRITDHLNDFKVENPVQRIEVIINAIDILINSPLIGRPTDSRLRELVLGRRLH